MSRPGAQVELRALRRSYGDKVALDDVSLEIEPGNFVVLLGPSGSGKTTMLRCLAGIERPSGGGILINGQMVAGPSRFVAPDKRQLAMVFQDYALWPHLTVEKNVGFPLATSQASKAARRETVTGLLRRVGIDHLAQRYPNELSGGEQQRVALARALAAEVGLILFDEPLSNLDADRRESLRIEIATLTRDAGASALYITHDQAEAFALADRIGVLNLGRLIQWGTPEEIYRSPSNPFVARFTGLAGELPATVTEVHGDRATISLNTSSSTVLTQCHTRAPAGAQATVFIRPSAASLTPDPQPGTLQAEVHDSAFTGRGYEHAVTIEGRWRLAKIFSPTRFDRGELVELRLDPASVNVMVDEDATTP